MSIIEAPDRSVEQRQRALDLANEVRIYRAGVKRDITAGELDVRDVLRCNDPRLQTMKVRELLMAVPRLGDTKVDAIMRDADASHRKTIGGLTPRQRKALVEVFRRWLEYRTLRRVA